MADSEKNDWFVRLFIRCTLIGAIGLVIFGFLFVFVDDAKLGLWFKIIGVFFSLIFCLPYFVVLVAIAQAALDDFKTLKDYRKKKLDLTKGGGGR